MPNTHDGEECCSKILERSCKYYCIYLELCASQERSHSTPFELWYGYPPNVKYFKVFGRKCHILKDVRNGKFDAKSDEGIFLGYSTRSKAYKCLNTNINKVVESANVNFDEFTKVHEVESTKELEQYKSFIYFYEDMPTKEDATNQVEK